MECAVDRPGRIGQHGVVVVHDGFWLSLHGQLPSIQQNGPIANALDGLFVVADDKQRSALFTELADAVKAFVLKVGVAH